MYILIFFGAKLLSQQNWIFMAKLHWKEPSYIFLSSSSSPSFFPLALFVGNLSCWVCIPPRKSNAHHSQQSCLTKHCSLTEIIKDQLLYYYSLASLVCAQEGNLNIKAIEKYLTNLFSTHKKSVKHIPNRII